MSNDIDPTSPPIIEAWRVVAVILITTRGMLFAHAIT